MSSLAPPPPSLLPPKSARIPVAFFAERSDIFLSSDGFDSSDGRRLDEPAAPAGVEGVGATGSV